MANAATQRDAIIAGYWNKVYGGCQSHVGELILLNILAKLLDLSIGVTKAVAQRYFVGAATVPGVTSLPFTAVITALCGELPRGSDTLSTLKAICESGMHHWVWFRFIPLSFSSASSVLLVFLAQGALK